MIFETRISGVATFGASDPSNPEERPFENPEFLTLHVGAGVLDDKHYGAERKSGGREKRMFRIAEKRTPMLNYREVSLTEQTEHLQIAIGLSERIGQEVHVKHVNPSTMFSNIVLEKVPDFSMLPPMSMMEVLEEGGARVFFTLRNDPCHIPAQAIARSCGIPEVEKYFALVAKDIRGMLAMVATSGKVTVGSSVRIYTPDEYYQK